MNKTIEELKCLRESEDKVEFKSATNGSYSYNGANKSNPKERRHCILGYIVALANEKGGTLIFGMSDKYPHEVVGTSQSIGKIGELEANIYRDLKIRTNIYELFDKDKKRVLVIEVPSRQLGDFLKFEDVPLMRVGEELLPMSNQQQHAILQEQEPDFSEKNCENITIEDLDIEAIDILKDKYSKKQNNPAFKTLSNEQALSDLKLVENGKVTNAALILLGKEDIIKKYLPQSAIRLEYRTSESNIHFDKRDEFTEPFFIMIDKLWNAINLRNGYVPIREGAYQTNNIPLFNEDVIREAINNAIAHRDYKQTAETIIKFYPKKIEITNTGGFPYGVRLDNLLTVSSTPRNRLLADVLSKTGIVERSGQGVDRIFLNTISEGKALPDYTKTDSSSVHLSISAEIEDISFAQFIMNAQESLREEDKLSVFDVILLNDIKLEKPQVDLNKGTIAKLLKEELIEARGNTRARHYILSKDYYELAGKLVKYSKKSDWTFDQALSVAQGYLKDYEKAKMSDFVELFEGHLTRKQIRTFVEVCMKKGLFDHEGEKNGRVYMLSEKCKGRFSTLNAITKQLIDEENLKSE